MSSPKHARKRSFDILNIPNRLLGIYLAVMLVAGVSVALFISYPCKVSFAALDPMLLLIALAICTVLGLCIKAISRASIAKGFRRPTTFNWVLAIGSIALFGTQLLITKGAGFRTGWDVGIITGVSQDSQIYFTSYPNQLFLTGLFNWLKQIAESISIRPYTFLSLTGALATTLSIYMTSHTAKRLAGPMAGYATFFISTVFIGLSPWILVPYSDTYAMLWTCLILFAYTCIDQTYIKIPFIIFSTLVGYAIKPTVIFATLAMLAIEAILLARRIKNKALPAPTAKRIATCILIGLCTFAVTCFAVNLTKTNAGVDVDEDGAFSMTHFLMMGFNPDTTGLYSLADVEASRAAATPEERSRMNLTVWKNRVKDMGPVGVAKLLLKKSLCNFNDGSFAWAVEGSFYGETWGDNEALKNWYGITETSTGTERAPLFEPFAQIVWYGTLVGAVACLLSRAQTKEIQTAGFALLMLAGFLMLFEARARYLFLYAPYFVLLGTLGWKHVFTTTRKRRGIHSL